jgi:imidazolonepropionase-like amidohydrolase
VVLAIHHVRLIDGTGRLIEPATVIVRDTKIYAAGTSSTIAIPRGATRVNGRGLTLLPGLVDCHVHLCWRGEADVVKATEQETATETLLKASRSAAHTLEAGVTTVRDLGSRDHSIFALKKAIEKGLTSGPRIIGAGLAICMVGGHLRRVIAREVEGAEQVRQVVREQIEAGAEVIKVIASGGVLTPGTSPDQPQLTPEELRSAVEEAARAGCKVAAHAHGASGMKNAIHAGAHSIEHATLMDDEAAALFEKHAVYMVPTLSALAKTGACRHGCGIPDDALDKAKAMTKRHQRSFRQAHRRGLLIAMGTDAGTPFNYHGDNAQELERMVALGMNPMDAILASTAVAARLIGLEAQIGTIVPGKEADLLLVQGNPLRRIEVLRDRSRLVGIMQAGRFVAGALAHTS